MRYASIRSMDITNGEGIGVSLFVQGCHFHCKNCFNQETWDFDGGKEWTEETEEKFFELISQPFVDRVSFLGGECLDEENVFVIAHLINEIYNRFPLKTIWLYTGYIWEKIAKECDEYPLTYPWSKENARRLAVVACDVVVDGQFVDELKDLTLKWRGSSNQRVIDVKKSLDQNKVVLYCD